MEDHKIIEAIDEDKEESGVSILRPERLSNFVGQASVKNNLSIFIQAAQKRGEAIDHILFYGPPGLGKTSLSRIVSKEMGVGFKMVSGPIITKAGDLIAILTNLNSYDIIFIDEIHRLSSSIEEMLYSAMEDGSVDITIGEGPSAKSIKIDLPPFTLIGATTRLGLISNPLQDRFGIVCKMQFYEEEELKEVIEKAAKKLQIRIEGEASSVLAKAGRGTPRIALRLLKRVRDFATIDHGEVHIDYAAACNTLKQLDIDDRGLGLLDYAYINFIWSNYGGGPVGLETIAAGLSEDKGAIIEVIEPYLMQIGFVNRTNRGRVLTSKCIESFKFK